MDKMQAFRERMLANFHEAIFPPACAGLQERRSAETRLMLLDATIDCLKEVGYARMTNQLIAERAQSSRGAMIHHYPAKASLIASVIDYTFYKRLERLVEGLHALDGDPDRSGKAWQLFLDNLHTREYAAYLELAIASRTDAELKAIFTPRAKLYDQVWREEVSRANVDWVDRSRELLQLCFDLSLAANEGLLLNEDVWDEPGRQARVKAMVHMVVAMLREGQLAMPVLPEAPKRKRAPRKKAAA